MVTAGARHGRYECGREANGFALGRGRAICRRGRVASPQTTLAATGCRGYAYRVGILDAVGSEIMRFREGSDGRIVDGDGERACLGCWRAGGGWGCLKLACTDDGCASGWGHDGETGCAIAGGARWLGVGYLRLGADGRS
jgi:hypothetical protein